MSETWTRHSPPSLTTGFKRSLRASSSSRSISISNGALQPGMRYPSRKGDCLGSQRPPPFALHTALARVSGYASSSPNERCGCAISASTTVSGRRIWLPRVRLEVLPRLDTLGIGRRERRRIGASPFGGVDSEETIEDDAEESGCLDTKIGTECTRSGVRGVGLPWTCSQQSSQTLPDMIGERGDS
jgi:hypothetical protein